MPDHAPFTPSLEVACIDAFDQSLDAKYLLIAGDYLARLLVKQGEIARHLQQAGG